MDTQTQTMDLTTTSTYTDNTTTVLWTRQTSVLLELLDHLNSFLISPHAQNYLILFLPLLIIAFFVRGMRQKKQLKRTNTSPKPYHATASQPYDTAGLFHLALNQTDPRIPPTTEWLNMGYWKDAQGDFPHACKALALRLLAHGGYNGGNILDVGHGTGESLLLFLQEPTIKRPRRLTGIVDLPSHYERSKRRVDRYMTTVRGSDLPTRGQGRARSTEDGEERACEFNGAIDVKLYLGDAVLRPGHSNIATHPLEATRLENAYDMVFGLDCVYHFKTRELFLQQSYEALKPGGRIALGDICFDSMPRGGFAKWLVTKLFIPNENMHSWADYKASLDRIGYLGVEMEDITAQVYPSFVSFLKSRGAAWWVFGTLFGRLVVPYSRFVLVSARKP